MTLSRTSAQTAALSSVSYRAIDTEASSSMQNALKQSTSGMVVCRQAPATCGELMQGAIDNRDFLVNCPIDLHARASVFTADNDGLLVRNAGQYGKVVEAIDLLESYLDTRQDARARQLPARQGGMELLVSSRVPRGKGMASSSADLAAAVSAVCEIRGQCVTPMEVSRLIAHIEPSDSVHLPGIAHVNQITGAVHACLPAPDDLNVLVVDCGGEIDTLAFDRARAHAVYRRVQTRLKAALKLMTCSLQLRDPVGVALAATISARISQQILPKPVFEDLLNSSISEGALGVNCAHSGTVLGVLHRGSDGLEERLSESIRQRFGSDLTIIGNHRIIAGGCHAI